MKSVTPPSKKKKARLLEGPIRSTLLKMTLPMVIAILSAIGFNLVDTYFVSRLGTAQLAAISFTFPVVMLLSHMIMGLGTGAASVISRAIGGEDHHQVQRLTTDSLTLSLLLVGIITMGGYLTIDPVFQLLGASPDMILLIREYMEIWYIGIFFLVIPMVGNNAIRATGDTKTPGMIMVIATVANLILDPILIFGWLFIPSLGLKGAALATVLARAITLVVALWVLIYRENMITWEIPSLREMWNSWKQILYVGLPAAFTNILIPLSIAIITGLVATYGKEAVAALGVSLRVEAFALIPVIAFSTALAPFVGQNWGAAQYHRVKKGVSFAFFCSLVWGLVMATVLWFMGTSIGFLFDETPAVAATVGAYLKYLPYSYGLLGIIILTAASLNAMNRPLHATGLNLVRLFVLLVPLAYLGHLFYGLEGIFAGAGVANLTAGLAALTLFWVMTRDKEASEEGK